MQIDLMVRGVNLADGKSNQDIAIRDRRIIEISTSIKSKGAYEIDARGYLATPPFVDSHFHMDSVLSYGYPRVNESGTLLEGIELWGELKPHLTVDAIKKRAVDLCHWAIARGTLAIRSHVDICDDRLLAVDALLEVREQMKPFIDIQLVAFPQNGYFRYPKSRENIERALEKGVDVVGGIPHFERTMQDGTSSIAKLCEIAQQRGLLVDMHCDESDDPMSRHIETLCCETQRLGLQGRVTASHLTSMHSMDNYYASKLISLISESKIHTVANPLINITLQGRHDTYPKRRGMTRVKEIMASGINLSFGHDSVMDPWYSLGSHDMLEVAHMGLHVAQMTGVEQMHCMFEAVTSNGAKTMNLDDYGLKPGCYADLVILQAADPIEAIRLRPARLYVIRRGKVISQTPPALCALNLEGRELKVDFTRPFQHMTANI